MVKKIAGIFSGRRDEIIIFFTALALRLAVYSSVKGSFLFNQPILDAKYYFNWAFEIARGDVLSLNRGVFTMSPGYPYFLAAVFSVTGFAAANACLVQIILSSLAAVLVYKTARFFASRPAALIGAAIYSLYSVSVFYDLMLLKGSLYQSLSVLLVYLFVKYLRAPPTRQAVLIFSVGLIAGFLAQLRPYSVLVLALCAAACALSREKQNLYKALLALFAGFLVFTLPVAARNYFAGGEFVFSTAHGGMNLYTGNNAYSKGPYTPLPFARTDPQYEQEDFFEEAQRVAGRKLTRAEADRFWYAQGAGFILKEPIKWLKLAGKKTLIFFNDYEPPINMDYYFFKDYHNLRILDFLPSFALIAACGIAGMLALAKYDISALFLIFYAAAYFLSNIVFFAVSEYRYPVVSVFAVFSAVFAEALAKRLKGGNIAGAIKILTAAAVLFAFSKHDIYSSLLRLRTYKKANLANSYFGLGYTYEENNLIPEAIAAYEKSVSVMPQDASLINLAGIYSRSGNLDKAKEMLLFSVRLRPRSYEARNNLGSIYYAQGDYGSAVAEFEEAHKLNPNSEKVKNNLKMAREKIR